MGSIYKYTLDPRNFEIQEVSMPYRSAVLNCQLQRGAICLWYEVPTDGKAIVPRKFKLFMTGDKVPEPGPFKYKYIATIQMSDHFVLHVYEIVIVR